LQDLDLFPQGSRERQTSGGMISELRCIGPSGVLSQLQHGLRPETSSKQKVRKLLAI
jgi:hypothetical protein